MNRKQLEFDDMNKVSQYVHQFYIKSSWKVPVYYQFAYSHVHSEFIMYLWVEAVGSDICPNASEDRVFDMVIICTMKNLGS